MRLSVLYGASAFGMLLTISVGMYYLLSSTIARENNEQAMGLLAALMEGIDGMDDLQHAAEQGPRPPQSYWVRILDSRGTVVSVSPGTPVSGVPDLAQAVPPLQKGGNADLAYVVASGWTPVQPDLPSRYLVQVYIDNTDDERLLQGYRRVLAFALLAAVAASVTIGVLVARAGLRPLAEITAAVGTVDAEQLEQRLVSAEWPSELRNLAVAFNRMLARLDLAFSRLSRASSDLAHELRTPLNNLRGEAEVALSRDRDPGDYRQVLGSALEELQRLSRIVDTLLFFARLDNPQNRLDVERLDAAAEVGKLLEFFEPLATENGVGLNLVGSGTVRANQTLLGQAVHNLLSNALQHTPSGGLVTIEIRAQPGHTTIAVADTGSGIAQGDLPHVFERFYRTATSRDGNLPGSGLGLSIVQSIMEWHGGTVTMQSGEGRGTRVVLGFPEGAATAS
jgi:two-component system heavy metal sensor histidine kinase CusS